ncbi:hypothetical protein BC829DRAFT_490976 [Chytridium lagenaria]|nr:hypothetical protein BC829DRAFT_490976 [Chytridium lagenaria]
MSSSTILSDPVFQTYAKTSTLLLLKSVGLGLSVVCSRLWFNSYGTPEDRVFPTILNFFTGGRWAPVKTINDKKNVDVIVSSESGYTHPVVKRVSACHANDIENVPILVLLGALYVTVVRPAPAQATRLLWTLVVARYAHTLSYLFGVQPFRGTFYILGGVTGLEMAVRILKTLV